MLASTTLVNSQNLVINHSFEDTIPSGTGTYCGRPESASPWLTPTLGSSDYWSKQYYCSAFWGSAGYQNPIDSGLAYCGFSLYDNYSLSNYREYIGGVLLDTMTTGHTYCINFYVSLANTSMLSTDKIGMYISIDSLIDKTTNQPFSGIFPQIENSSGNIITDTLNWVLISGNYTAQGGEKFITIGNFYDDANTNVDTVQGGIYNFAYYYIDDVSVVDCTVGVNELYNFILVPEVFPNPAKEIIHYKLKQVLLQQAVIEMSDVYGKTIYSTTLDKGKNNLSINVSAFARGIYFLKTVVNGYIAQSKKIILQ